MNAPTPIEILSSESEQINPAILLAEEFMRRDPADILDANDIERAETVLQSGRGEIEAVKKQLAAFNRTPSTAAREIPTGF